MIVKSVQEAGTEPSVVREGNDEVWVLRLNRPHRLNSLDPAAISLLRERLIEFRDTASARVCVLTGTGLRGFCTGADLKETLPPSLPFAAAAFLPDSDAVEAGNYIRGLNLERLSIGKPLIAAINGHALGGGLEIALACDIRIASTNATFGLPEVKVGSIPAVGGIQWLMRSVGHSQAMTMILSGGAVDALTAERMGLVSAVHAPEELLARAIELANTIAGNAPLAVRAARMLAREGLDMSVPQAMLLEQFVWGTLRDTKDRVEGRLAFAEKRTPVYRGR
jgi:E-phenylitaconyl-CoA hydratase